MKDEASGRYKLLRAHRAAYELFVGPIPVGMWVLHRCDNPPCVNPHHLFLGTNTDNVHDMIAKGRNRTGESHTNAKLTESDVNEIRRIYERGDMERGARPLARKYGVSSTAISNIVQGRVWTRRGGARDS